MPVALNVKDEHVHQQIKAIAKELKTSQTDALRQAVDQFYRSLPESHDRHLRRLRQISEEAAELIPAGVTLSDDDLYDNDGLPQ